MSEAASTNYAKVWIEGTDTELRLSAMEQDARFQRAMQKEMGMLRPAPAPALLPAPPKVRDVISINTSVHRLPQSTAQRIIAEVCTKHRVSRAELLGHQREQRIVIARHEAFYRMKTETTLSLPAIGTRMGSKDHSTVHHGVKRHIERMAKQ